LTTENQKKVMLYSLLEISRSTYIKIQILVFACLVIAFILSLLLQMPQKFSDDIFPGNILIIIVIVAVLEILETYFTLRKN